MYTAQRRAFWTYFESKVPNKLMSKNLSLRLNKLYFIHLITFSLYLWNVCL